MRSALAVIAVLAVLAAAPVTANKNHPKHKPTPQPTFSPTKSPATLSPVRQARSSEIADGEARPNMKFAATLSVSGPLCAAPARSRTARNISLCRARCTVSRTLHEARPLRVRGCHARGRALTSLPRRHGQKCTRVRSCDASAISDFSTLALPPDGHAHGHRRRADRDLLTNKVAGTPITLMRVGRQSADPALKLVWSDLARSSITLSFR